MTVLYLHGLGSSPQSQKAVLIRERLSNAGVVCWCPELSLPSFGKLSIHRILDEMEILLGQHRPSRIVGSSFGAFIALHALHRHRHDVQRLALLAPALRPHGLVTGPVLSTWKCLGALPLMHYASGRSVPVHFDFAKELLEFDPEPPAPPVPTLVIHGRYDSVVPVQCSIEYAERYPNVRLQVVEDDHQLLREPARLTSSVCDFIRSGLGPEPVHQ